MESEHLVCGTLRLSSFGVPQDENPKCPLTVDPAGVYIRGDGPPANRTFLCGLSPGADDEDPDEPPLHVDYDWFEERIWPVRADDLLCSLVASAETFAPHRAAGAGGPGAML